MVSTANSVYYVPLLFHRLCDIFFASSVLPIACRIIEYPVYALAVSGCAFRVFSHKFQRPFIKPLLLRSFPTKCRTARLLDFEQYRDVLVLIFSHVLRGRL